MLARTGLEAAADATVIAAPFARLALLTQDDRLISLNIVADAPLRAARSAIAREAVAQLRAYFKDPHHRFDVPLLLEGTAFQRRVWQALQRIPVGKVRSYSALANSLASGARAIGNACRANPIAVIVPCHRVVSASGMGGFMGKTGGAPLQFKQALLAHEHADG